MIKIGIADDHAIFRKGLKFLFKTELDVKIQWEASDGEEILEKMKVQEIDVLLLDLQMPKISGREIIEILKPDYPHLKILILTFEDSLEVIQKLFRLGIDGFCNKNTNPQKLIDAVKIVFEGGIYLEDSIKSQLKELEKSEINTNLIVPQFSEREMEIIRLHSQEYSGKEIANLLHISPRTIEVHKRNLMNKLDAKNFIGVIIYALKHKLI